ncbi:MAG: hypothetical protein Q8K85_14140 [Hyphomicrobium sp.]|nr:hypothetical protein [Hyphomicrobium sp.]
MGIETRAIIEYCVAAVLAGLDFNRLHAFMVRVDWKWGTSVPSPLRLQQAARGLLEELVLNPDVTSIEMGGLRAVREFHGERCEIRLAFEVDAVASTCPRPFVVSPPARGNGASYGLAKTHH